MNSTKSSFKKFILLVLIFFVVGIEAIYSQISYTDSLKLVLKNVDNIDDEIFLNSELCWELAFENPDSSVVYGEKAINLALIKKDPIEVFSANRYIARSYSFQGNLDEAIYLLESSLELSKEYNIPKRELLLAYNDLGNYLEQNGNYDLALENYLIAVDLCGQIEEEGEFYKYAIHINICTIYTILEEYDLVIKYALEAVGFFENTDEEYYKAEAMHALGVGYERKGNYEKAEQLYYEALEIFRKYEDPFSEGRVLNSLGTLNQQLGNFNLSKEYYLQSYYIDTLLGDNKSIAISLSNIAGIYVELGKVDTAISLLEQSIELAKKYGELQMLMTTYKYTADAYNEAGNYELAYTYRIHYDQIRDSLITEEKIKEVMKLQEQFEVELKEKEINSLRLENEKIEATSRFNYTLLIGGILALALMIFIIILLYKNRRDRDAKKRAELEHSILSLRSTALMAQLNPHLVFNILNSIQGLVVEEEIEKANIYISKFSKFMRKSLSMSKNTEVTLEDELIITREYFELEKLRFSDQISLSIQENLSDKKIKIPPLLLQPLIENSIKHGIMPTDSNGTIIINLFETSEEVIIEVTDNGLGITESSDEHKSEGLRISKERLKALNPMNDLEIVSRKNPTTIRLTIKKNH